MILKNFDIELLEKNEDCKRIVDEDTLFFLPHLDHYLTGNLIKTNIKNLKFVTIIGNQLQEQYKILVEDKVSINEKPIILNEKDEFYEGFNHTFITTFH